MGAHYDGVGRSPACLLGPAGDNLCNSATDNTTGVAAVIDLVGALGSAAQPPRRSVVIAFWDDEEPQVGGSFLLGSRFYTQNPLIPLGDTVAYVNLDIQAANLRPSLRNFTFAIGAETGGSRLAELVRAATAPSSLDTRRLSSVFGQNLSDHVNFVNVGVPSVFLSDGQGPCYHRPGDSAAVVDFGKLDAQAATLKRLVGELASTDVLPTFATGNSAPTFVDASNFRDLLVALQSDLAMFPQAQASQLAGYLTQLQAIVDAGPAAFGGQQSSQVLGIAASTIQMIRGGECDGYLD